MIAAVLAAIEVRGLSPTERLLLIILAKYANREGLAWPSISRLARDLERTERVVYTALNRLVEVGYIEIQHRPGKPSLYRIRLDQLAMDHTGARPGRTATPEENFTPEESFTPEENFTPDAPTPEENFRGSGPTPEENFTPPLKKTSPHPCRKLHPEPVIEPAKETSSPPSLPPPSAAELLAGEEEEEEMRSSFSPSAKEAGARENASARTARALEAYKNPPGAGFGTATENPQGLRPGPTLTREEALAEMALRQRRLGPPPRPPAEMVRALREAGVWERLAALRRRATDDRAWQEWLAGPLAALWRRTSPGAFASALEEALLALARRPDVQSPFLYLEKILRSRLGEAAPPPPQEPAPPTGEDLHLLEEGVPLPDGTLGILDMVAGANVFVRHPVTDQVYRLSLAEALSRVRQRQGERELRLGA